MNDFLRLCPKCKLHLRIQLEKDFIQFNCKCEYDSSMSYNEGLDKFRKSEPPDL